RTPTRTPTTTPTVLEQAGCRVTGGRQVLDDQVEGEMEITKATGGGQVGAPCGCIGCFDEFDHIQGNWTHSRKKKQGSFKAVDFNSLVCGCECENSEGSLSTSFDGNLCNEGESGNKKNETVAFRVEEEGHGEPGGGHDEYRIWIYKLQLGESVKDLAVDI